MAAGAGFERPDTTSVLSISWSALRVYEQCHHRHYLEQSRKQAPLRDIRQFFHGVVADRCMRAWLCDPDRQSGQMAAGVDDMMRQEEQRARSDGAGVVRWRHSADKRQVAEFCRELLVRLEPILLAEVIPRQFKSEHSFKVPITIPGLDGSPIQIQLVGRIDILALLQFNPVEWAIWDLKATLDNTYYRKVLGQLVFYALAVEAKYPGTVTKVGLFQPMCDQRIVVIDVTRQEKIELLQRVIAMAHGILRQDRSPKESNVGCPRCPTSHACIKYKPVIRNGNKVLPIGGVI